MFAGVAFAVQTLLEVHTHPQSMTLPEPSTNHKTHQGDQENSFSWMSRNANERPILHPQA